MLKDAIAKAVPTDVRCRPAAGQRRGGPVVAPLFVTKIQAFPARIAHRVVEPRSETEFVGVLTPGIGLAVLRDDGAEVRIRQNIYPRRRRHMPVRSRNDIRAAIRGESSQPIEKGEIGARYRSGWQRLSAAGWAWGPGGARGGGTAPA